MKIFFKGLFLLFSLISTAQKTPTLFEPGKISNGGVFGLTISPDATRALWVSSNGKRDTLRIVESQKINGEWTTPVIASFSSSNGEWKDIDPMFSPDGKLLLFQSNRNTGRQTDRKDFDIWAVALTTKGWGLPYNLGDSVNTTASESYASLTDNGSIYFMKDNEDGIGKSDIYFSELTNGKYSSPQNMGQPINTTERESNPFIAPNGKYIIYFSTDSTGLGEVDLYISFRKKSKWSKPKNLGNIINSADAEFCPFYHKKEKKLYFSRQIKQAGRFKEDIFSVDFNPKHYR